MARRNETIIEILYDAPWWVSVVASVLVYGVLQYIVPSLSFKNPLLQGVPGLGPIFAPWVALMLLIPAPFSFLKSLKKRKLLDKQRDIESIRSLSWKQLEELVGEAYRRQGYSVLENEGAGPDGGVDLWLEKNGNRYLVQCKHWRSQKVGVMDERRCEIDDLNAHGRASCMDVSSIVGTKRW
jgi:restriction system protein